MAQQQQQAAPATQQAQAEALARLKRADQAHHLHPFTDERMLGQYGPLMVSKAKGTRLFVESGVQLLDMMAGLGCVNIGYGHPDMAKAIGQAAADLSYYHTFQQSTNPYAATLAERLAALVPGPLNKVFFANSGSEANETIVKLIRAYWRARGKPDKTDILARDFAYHGSTLYTASMNGLAPMHAAYGLPLPGIHHGPSPWWYRFGKDQDPESFGRSAAKALEQKILEIGPDKIGALFLEPIQVTAGAVIAPDSYWPEIARIVKDHDLLLVMDEVVTGFGRCGSWLVHPEFGLTPDFVTLAKGLTSAYQPLAAAMVSDRVMATLTAQGMMQHGYTTSGHPVACAAALKNLDILDQGGLVARAGDSIGARFAADLKALEAHPLVGEVRVKGLLAGIELVKDKASREQYPMEQGVCSQVMNAALLKGVVIRAVGNALVLCPPLSVSNGEIDFAAKVLHQALDEVQAKLG